MKVTFHLLFVFPMLMLIATFNPANAETCDAGHGCRITCKDGCGAIYWEETGHCSKFCAKPSKTHAKSKEDRVTAIFQDAPKEQVTKILKSLGKF